MSQTLVQHVRPRLKLACVVLAIALGCVLLAGCTGIEENSGIGPVIVLPQNIGATTTTFTLDASKVDPSYYGDRYIWHYLSSDDMTSLHTCENNRKQIQQQFSKPGIYYVSVDLSNCSGRATITVGEPGVKIEPQQCTLTLGAQRSFSASLYSDSGYTTDFTWSVVNASGQTIGTGGTITSTGQYTAPLMAPGTYYVKATSKTTPPQSATVPVVVQSATGHVIVQ